MAEDDEVPESGPGEQVVEDEDELVDGFVGEILDLLDDMPIEHDDAVDTAVFTCAAQRAVDAEIPKEEFLDALGRMYEESKEMGALERRMNLSLERGKA